MEPPMGHTCPAGQVKRPFPQCCVPDGKVEVPVLKEDSVEDGDDGILPPDDGLGNGVVQPGPIKPGGVVPPGTNPSVGTVDDDDISGVISPGLPGSLPGNVSGNVSGELVPPTDPRDGLPGVRPPVLPRPTAGSGGSITP